MDNVHSFLSVSFCLCPSLQFLVSVVENTEFHDWMALLQPLSAGLSASVYAQWTSTPNRMARLFGAISPLAIAAGCVSPDCGPRCNNNIYYTQWWFYTKCMVERCILVLRTFYHQLLISGTPNIWIIKLEFQIEEKMRILHFFVKACMPAGATSLDSQTFTLHSQKTEPNRKLRFLL